LSSIQGLINKNNIIEANAYLSDFSTLLRSALKNTDKELIPLSVEIQIIETYIKLEQLRFPFQYQLTLANDINADTIEIPPLLMQPIIENAIKHGVSSMNEKGNVQIGFSSKDSDLIIRICDNGNGFNNAIQQDGVGLKLTKERIHLWNQNFREQPILLTIDSAVNTGTIIILILKNWL